MNATTLYVEACKCMLVLEQDNGAAWDNLFHLLPKLRQSLTCRVCRGLLVDPYGSHSCFHYVCRGCLRKKRSLNPGCRWCLNLDSLVEDKQIRIVLACYQKLCECVLKSSAVHRLTTQNGELNNTLAILQEAITNPISLVESCQDQVPAEKPIATMANSKMAPSKSRDVAATRAAEVKPLSKRKLVAEPTESADLKKKKRKKHFKGTYYNYNKKKKPGPAKLNRCENANASTVKSETVAAQSGQVTVVDDKSEEVQVVVDVVEEQTDSHVPIPPATKSVEQKPRSCRCGTWYMKPSSSTVSRCVSSRCSCYSGGYMCQSCQCAYCANPYNNNNNNNNNIEKGNEDTKLKFVDDKTVVVSGH